LIWKYNTGNNGLRRGEDENDALASEQEVAEGFARRGADHAYFHESPTLLILIGSPSVAYTAGKGDTQQIFIIPSYPLIIIYDKPVRTVMFSDKISDTAQFS
jgi:hypothetical protein